MSRLTPKTPLGQRGPWSATAILGKHGIVRRQYANEAKSFYGQGGPLGMRVGNLKIGVNKRECRIRRIRGASHLPARCCATAACPYGEWCGRFVNPLQQRQHGGAS